MHRTISTFLVLTMILGTMMVMVSEKWFLMWVGLELSTLALIPMLCSKFSPRKMEASMKYFLIQALSAALLLKSALMKAWITGSWSILDPLNKISLLLLMIALAFKMGLAPCHFWLPDVLQGLPFFSGLMMASWQKIAPLMILLSIEQLTSSNIMMALSLFSVIIGGWGGLNQTQMRKMLAFSSIGKMGWMAMTSLYSQKAALSMLIVYLMINSTMFMIADFKNFWTLGHLKMIAQLSPTSVLMMTLTMLSLGGLPPLTGFMMKFMSLYFLLKKNFMILSSLLILGSLLSLFFYLRISFKASLILFPHHIMSLTSWRKTPLMTPLKSKIWLTSLLFVLSTMTIPLTLLLYMFI